ncbi:MAG: phosphatase PAP2 family protein [Actinobacteria bacterium]|nr:phosphatase PAP2 family protein [Actinomycetota bacterium]
MKKSLTGWSSGGQSRRSAEHRRAGPGRPHPAARIARRARKRRLGARPTHALAPAQWAIVAVLAPVVGLVLARKRLGTPRLVTLGLVSAVPVAVAAVAPRRKWRYAVVGAAYMWSFTVTWTLPYERMEKLRGRLRIDYPVRVDTLLGLGVPPTLRLQRALRNPPQVTGLDRVMLLTYGSWIVPHALLAWLLLRHDEYVPRAAGRLAAAYHLTTPFYYLLPTAPPWWASEEAGRMGGEVERVRRHVLNSLVGRDRQAEGGEPAGNPWGSMPSDHIASAAITAMGLAELGPVYGALGWSYVAAAGFSVVYLGEHYLVDVLVGLALALAIQRGEAWATPLVHRAVLQIDRLAS